MRIPDLRRMVVNTKVHEAMVSRVHGEVWQPTGFSDALRAGLLTSHDSLARVLSQHAVTDLKEKLHEYDMEKVQDGQKARVRVEAFSDRVLPGHVKSVATVASQQDWMSADVKVYQTFVAIDESVDGLKPGMSAEVTIDIDATDEPVLALPLQAVVGGAELGPKRKVFVKTPTGAVEEREIVVGLSNEKMVEVRSGLIVGDEVVVNPRVLLGDRAKVRTAGEERPEGGGEGRRGKGRGKGGMKGGEGPPKDGPPYPGGGYPKGGPPTAGQKTPVTTAG
jgi:HlyD family secretion protein